VSIEDTSYEMVSCILIAEKISTRCCI